MWILIVCSLFIVRGSVFVVRSLSSLCAAAGGEFEAFCRTLASVLRSVLVESQSAKPMTNKRPRPSPILKSFFIFVNFTTKAPYFATAATQGRRRIFNHPHTFLRKVDVGAAQGFADYTLLRCATQGRQITLIFFTAKNATSPVGLRRAGAEAAPDYDIRGQAEIIHL